MPVVISSEHFEIWPDIANIWLVGLDTNTTVSSHKLISSDFFSISIVLVVSNYLGAKSTLSSWLSVDYPDMRQIQ